MDVGINQRWSTALEVPVQGQCLVKTGQPLVQSLVHKNVNFGDTAGKEVVMFFQPNVAGIILWASWVNWANQNWSRGNLKKWHFFVWTPYWKHWPIRLNSVGPSSFWVSESRVKIFDLKSGSVNARKYSAPNHAWSCATCPVISLAPFSKEILMRSGRFRPSSIRLSGVPLAPKVIKRVYQLNWGVFCTLIRSYIVTILACLDLFHAWILIAYLLDRAEISPQWRTIIMVTNAPVDERIGH